MNEILLNVVVLVFEVLYYALFMKFARKEGKFWRYLLLFSAIMIFFYFVGTSQMYSYLFLILMILYGIKYIVKVNTSLYDMFLISIMLLLKLIIEFGVMILFYSILGFNHFITTLLFGFLKLIFIILFRKKIYLLNKKLNKLWDNNNFYIRYLSSIVFYIYVIVSIISVFWLIVI